MQTYLPTRKQLYIHIYFFYGGERRLHRGIRGRVVHRAKKETTAANRRPNLKSRGKTTAIHYSRL